VTLDLAAELADNDIEQHVASAFVDPRTIPTRFSLLKQMALSPAHYLHACQQPQDDSLASRLGAFASDRKEAFRVGNAIDVMLFSDTDEKVIVYPGRRDPRVKAWQEFQREAADKGVVEILSGSEMEIVKNVVAALRARKDAMALLLKDTIVQQRIDWQWMGKPVRSTPDARSRRHLVDLKSAVSAEPEAFKRQSRKFFYHAQAALYGDAMIANGEPEVGERFLVVVEKAKPHPVTVFRIAESMIDIGARLNRLWMEKLQQCELANAWPVYAPEPAIVDIELSEDQVWDV
jgi:hypothetical protein